MATFSSVLQSRRTITAVVATAKATRPTPKAVPRLAAPAAAAIAVTTAKVPRAMPMSVRVAMAPRVAAC